MRSGESFQNRKRFSSATHKPRALDGSGPFRKIPNEKGKEANAKKCSLQLVGGLPPVGPVDSVPFCDRNTGRGDSMLNMHYVGLDIHEKTISSCVRQADGTIIQEAS